MDKKNVLAFLVASAALSCVAAHKFLYSDFMNRKIVHVDESDAAAYREAFLPEIAFDLTRCGQDKVVAAQRQGCRLYDLGKLRLVSEIKDEEHLRYATSATRLQDGCTFILDGPAIHEYGPDGKWARKFTFGDRVKQTRIMRFTNRGTVLIGAYTGFAEVVLDESLAPEKRVRAWFQLPGTARYCYQAEWQKDGTLLTTGGYLPEVVRFASDGRVLARQQAAQPEGLSNYFYAGFEVLPNGNCIVANWTGHSGRDFRPGWKLIEFAPNGKVVWHWNAPWAGTVNSVIVFE